LFLQKRKGAVGWIKIRKKYGINTKWYYGGIIWYFLRNIYKYNLKDIFAFFLWCFVFLMARISAEFHKKEKISKIWIRFPRNVSD